VNFPTFLPTLVAGQSPITARHINELSKTARQVAHASGADSYNDATGLQTRRRLIRTRRFYAKIVSSSQDGANLRWAYTIAEVRKDGAAYAAASWETFTGNREGTAYNMAEYPESASGEAIANDTIIVVYAITRKAGETEYWFDKGGTGAAEATGFWAKITASSAASTDGNQWYYSFAEVEKTSAGYSGWSTLEGGRTGTNEAYNSLEDMNTAAGVCGNGVDPDNLDTDDFTFSIQPCPANAIVWMREIVVDTTTEYWFQYANGVDGGCDE